jgi:hypothetical protein
MGTKVGKQGRPIAGDGNACFVATWFCFAKPDLLGAQEIA